MQAADNARPSAPGIKRSTSSGMNSMREILCSAFGSAPQAAIRIASLNVGDNDGSAARFRSRWPLHTTQRHRKRK